MKNFPTTTTIIIVCLIGISIFLGIKCLGYKSDIERLAEDKNTVAKWVNNNKVFEIRWKKSNYLHSEFVDLNYDNNYEISTYYNIAGKKVNDFFDTNENGIFEETKTYNSVGEIVQKAFDKNEDGEIDAFVLYYSDQLTISFTDENKDGRFEKIYIQDLETNKSKELTPAEIFEK